MKTKRLVLIAIIALLVIAITIPAIGSTYASQAPVPSVHVLHSADTAFNFFPIGGGCNANNPFNNRMVCPNVSWNS
jgi:hypothetical protein